MANGTTADQRTKIFNYVAYRIISAEQDGKWFALVGADHIKKIYGIQGINTMTGAVSVIIHENPYNEISFNQPHVNDANQVVHVRILNQRFNQAPLIQEQTMTLEQVENCRINYEKYSAGIFSLRNFLWENNVPIQVMKTLKEASSDKERFSIATKYLRENNSDAYADALRKALWPDSLANS